MIRFHRIYGIILKYSYYTLHGMERFMEIFFWPVVDLLLWGFMAFYLKDTLNDVNVVSVLLGGLVLWSILYSVGRDIALLVLLDVWSRNLYNTYSTPLKAAEMMLGSIVISFVKSLIMTIIMVALAWFMYAFDFLALGIFFFHSLLEIILFGTAFGIFATGIIYRFGARVQSICWGGMFLIQPLMCVFYPLQTLPASWQYIALALPPTHVFEALRNFLYQGTLPTFESSLIPLGLNLIYLLLATIFFQRQFLHAKKRGWFMTMD